MAEEDSPLVKALPPESDYLTYLTIVEYNLTTENLPILHKVLQDEALNINIGWDLVHLLLPLLPDSEPCLQDIARLGNPREVILKVTESLRLIEYEPPEDAERESPELAPNTLDARVRAESSTYPIKTAPTEEGVKMPGSSQMVELPPPLPLAISQFVALLSMLAILHPRISTKYPSRFLSTTLQAILASFSNSLMHREEMIVAVVKTVKAVQGIQRPTLPSRKSSGMLSSVPVTRAQAAADPEGTATAELSADESAMQKKLLQSFVTHILEEYMLNLPSEMDVPGTAWCSRIMEKLHPERLIPHTKTIAARFATEERLHRRIDAVGQLVTLAQDLKIADNAMLAACLEIDKLSAAGGQNEDEPPASADDIPLSRVGCVMLYTARQASSILYGNSKQVASPSFAIFPDHQELVKHCLSSPGNGAGALGTEPEALIDAVVALGLVCLARDAIGEPATDDQFTEYLQVTALLSSNCPSPNVRGHAHYLTSTVLRSQPDDNIRLGFIRDTLEHCPFENLKVSAVGWIKGETIEANPPTPVPGAHEQGDRHREASNVFATPLALDSLAPFLFPSLNTDLVSAPLLDAWTTFQANLSFYLASLNFIYLLLCAKHLHHNLGVQDLWTNSDIAGSFLQALREGSARFSKELEEGGDLSDERTSGVVAELSLIDETIQRVTQAVGNLNE